MTFIVIVSYSTNSNSRCWSHRGLLIWDTSELQDCSFKQTNEVLYKEKRSEDHVLEDYTRLAKMLKHVWKIFKETTAC